MKTKNLFSGLFTAIIMAVPALTLAQNFVWAKAMGGTGADYGNSIATDASGNVYTTGYFAGTADFDPGAGVFNLTSAGITDIFVSKLDAAGNFVWAKAMGGATVDYGNSIAIDASGNVYTTGYFGFTADFDPGAGVFNLTSLGQQDIFVSKLDAAGNFVWAKAMGGTSYDFGNSIAIDASGNVYTTGYFCVTADFDPGAGVFNLTSPSGSEDIFVSKLDAAGNFVWAKAMGGTSSDIGNSITTDASGNVYTTGYFRVTADFDPGAGVFNLTSAGGNDIFISKLDASGNFVWAKAMGGAGTDIGNSIAIDASGNVYTTGFFGPTADFDPGAGVFNLTSASGSEDIFVSKLDAAGNFVWANAMGGAGTDIGNSIAIDASGNVYTTGYFRVTADFDPGPGVFNLTPAGYYDIFVSKLDAAGNFVWANAMGGPFADYGNSITTDASGNVYTTGFFGGTADFDPGAGVFNLTSAGNADIFVHKMCQVPLILGVISGATTVCSGATNIYSIASVPFATSYTWSLPGGWSGASATNTISTTPGSSGIFTVTASNGCGASPAQTLSVTVNATPTVSAATNNTLLCTGQTATLTASGANTYTWSPGGAGTSIAISPTVTTNFTVTGTNSVTGCNNSTVLTQSVSTCAGISELSTPNSELKVYPNPSSGIINVQAATALGLITVYNTLGQVVYQTKSANTTEQINISNQAQGIYILRAQNIFTRIIKE